MPMRVIKPPKTITVQPPKGSNTNIKPEEVLFSSFVGAMLNQTRFNTGRRAAKAATAIEEAAEKSTGGALTLAEEDWELLKDAVENPSYRDPLGREQKSFPWQPWQTRQLMPYADAISNAEQKNMPAEVPKEED